MQALILAAGRGSRLGEKTSDLPKCLLEIGRKPLIEHQLETLADAGVGPVGMVVGYCADEIREVVGIGAEYIENSRWNVTNSLYSFSMARDWITGPVLILNSDTIVHPDVVNRLARHSGDCFAYDSSSGNGGEHMKVKLSDGQLGAMGKDLALEEISGENVGIISLTESTALKLLERADELLQESGGETLWLGSAVNSIAEDVDIAGVDVAGLPWGEIDFSYDLVRARKEVWPAIKRDMEQRRLPWRALRWGGLAAVFFLMAYLGFRTWLSPTESAWGTVALESVGRLEITSTSGRTRTWARLDAGRTSDVHVTGPSRIQIETRLLMSTGAGEDAPYVLEVVLDGRRRGWYLEKVAPSKTWTSPKYAVGKRIRIQLEIPAGEHTVGIKLVAADSSACLVSVRQEEESDAAD